MMETALIWAEESYCKRKKVGAILAKKGRILSTGYNGTVTGSDNNCEEHSEEKYYECSRCGSEYKAGEDAFVYCDMCQGHNAHMIEKKEKKLISKNTVVHAEANTIAFAGKHGIKTKGCTIYVTLSPCIECAKIMVQHGIKKVVYREEYRNTDGINFLKENRIKVKKV